MRARRWLVRLAASERHLSTNRQLGLFLAVLAGAVNAGGYMVIDRYTSHMTGLVSSIATSLALDDHPLVLMAVLFVASFIGGAVAAAVFINLARTRYPRSEFALAFMLEAFLLMLFSLCTTHLLPIEGSFVACTIALLCFIMGLQNAIMTKMSDGRIRTTHVTGICTDIGIELGRFFYTQGGGRRDAEFQRDKLLFNSRMLGLFLLGGILGAEAFAHIGFVTIVPLAMVLVIIAIAPLWDDMPPAAI